MTCLVSLPTGVVARRALGSRRAEELLVGICQQHDVTAFGVRGRSRLRTLTMARHHWWFKIRELGYSYPEIARIVERDHTSVLQGIRSFVRVTGLTGIGVLRETGWNT